MIEGTLLRIKKVVELIQKIGELTGLKSEPHVDVTISYSIEISIFLAPS